jgi:hypothetical protein
VFKSVERIKALEIPEAIKDFRNLLRDKNNLISILTPFLQIYYTIKKIFVKFFKPFFFGGHSAKKKKKKPSLILFTLKTYLTPSTKQKSEWFLGAGGRGSNKSGRQ